MHHRTCNFFVKFEVLREIGVKTMGKTEQPTKHVFENLDFLGGIDIWLESQLIKQFWRHSHTP